MVRKDRLLVQYSGIGKECLTLLCTYIPYIISKSICFLLSIIVTRFDLKPGNVPARTPSLPLKPTHI